MKKALITGISGQDGSYLAEYLVGLGYEVHGIAKGIAYENLQILPKSVRVHFADMRDELSLENVFRKSWPDEVYNLAGQVFVPTSWTQPTETFDVNTGGLARLLKIVQGLKFGTRVYQASSSEMFGNQNGALDENSPMRPISPYGASKFAAHVLCDVYRQKGMFVVGGILFNHEGPRRSEYMVTRKITKVVAKWACGEMELLELGNTRAARDWGSAKDYVKAMHLMLQQNVAEDFVVGTGETHSVEQFLMEAIRCADVKVDEDSLIKRNNGNFYRGPNEIHSLKADWSKIKKLGWKPETSFRDLVKGMVDNDIELERKRRELGVMV